MEQKNRNRKHDKKHEQKREVMLMRHYLSQYYRAVLRRSQLEDRLRNVCAEMDAPIGGINYSPVNYSSVGKTSSGSASFTFRKSEIETRIEEQKKEIEASLLRIMDVMDYLDPISDERMILELYYIDRLPWKEVQKRASMSRSTCYEYRDKGINQLLSFKRVRILIEKYGKEKGL